jgi:ribosomal protein L11 methyltransferase
VSVDRSPALILRFRPDTTAAARDALVARLADFDLLAIQEDDAAAPTMWTAHFRSHASRDAAADALLQTRGDAGILQIEATDIEDDDWARRTQADLPAVRIGRVVVAPPWDRPASRSAGTPAGPEIVVEIEPSRGFGTGHHQSTRLCLVLLQGRQLGDQTLIDVGTGSGVLAVVAAKLGAAFVSAIDVDPDAVDNARENIVRNGVERIVEAHVRDLTESNMSPADVVTANLTGTLLARYADRLGALVRPAGSLIASGFTIDEKDLVLEAFADRFELTESAEEDGWWAFVLTRRQPQPSA